MDFLKGKKTIIVNAFVALATVITMVYPDAELPTASEAGELVEQADVILTKLQALIVSAVAFFNIVLRALTTTPVWRKE